MSVLDNNEVERLNKEAENAVKTIAAKQPILCSFRNAILAVYHATKIQHWLYEHTCFPTQYNMESMHHFVKSMNIDWEVENQMMHIQPVFLDKSTNNQLSGVGLGWDDTIPLPITCSRSVALIQHSKYKQYDEFCGKIQYEMTTVESYIPHPIITKHVTELNLYGETVLSYTSRQPDDGATLFLKGVDYIPSYIAEKDDNEVYHWIMPIKNIYLCDCPNIPRDILDLPYVHTFEEMNWIYI